MLGWINDCVEKLVIEKYGVEAWHKVKELAGCDSKDDGYLKLEHYPDRSTLDLVNAAGELSGLSQAEVFEAFGKFFVPYIIGEGYENLLCCQGSTLKDWMTNINAIHQHLQTTFPKKMIMPEFWCEENEDRTLTLFYFSSRGNYLAPLAVGLVTEVAMFQFDLDIRMDRKSTQGVDGSRFTR
jgi:guanylate cyclase soluble subunit beta